MLVDDTLLALLLGILGVDDLLVSRHRHNRDAVGKPATTHRHTDVKVVIVMQVVHRVGALLGVTELDHDRTAVGGGDAALKDGPGLVTVSTGGADEIEARSLILAGTGEGLLPLVFPLLLFGEALVAAVITDDATGGGGGEGLAEGEADVILDLDDRRAWRDTRAEGNHADNQTRGLLTLHDRLAGGTAAGDEGDRTGKAAALIGAIGEDDGRVGAHALVGLVGRHIADGLGADLADAVLEVREDDERIVGAVILKDVDPTTDGAFLKVIGILLVDRTALGGQFVDVGLRRDEFALGVLLGTVANRAIQERSTLEFIATDDFIIMHVNEHAVAEEDVSIRELIADFRFDAIEIRKHRGRGVEVDR